MCVYACAHVCTYVFMHECMSDYAFISPFIIQSVDLSVRLPPPIHLSIPPSSPYIHPSIYVASYLTLPIYLIFDSCLYTAMYVYPCISMTSMYHCINHWLSSTGVACGIPRSLKKNKAPKMMIGRQSFPLKMVPFSVAMLNF